MLLKPLQMNLIVRDLDEMLDFYRNVLGFEVTVESEFADEVFSQGAGLPDVSIKMAHLKLPGSDFLVEMYQYNEVAERQSGISLLEYTGYRNLAFQVEDIELGYQELISQGVSFVTPPVSVKQTGYVAETRFCYFRDPEGNLIELIQQPRRSSTVPGTRRGK